MRSPMTARLAFVSTVAALSACGGRPSPSAGGETLVCPDGTPNAKQQIRTVNCSTVVQFDGTSVSGSITAQTLGAAGFSVADQALRDVSKAATDAQIQFTQTCELYNACNLTSGEYRDRLDEAQRRYRDIGEKVALLEAAKGEPAVLRQAFTDLYASAVPKDVREQRTLALELTAQARAG